MSDAVIWIPARMGSRRLPGKLARRVAGKPLLAHTIQRALQSRAGQRAGITVVCDHPELAGIARDAGAAVVLAEDDVASGTGRLALAWQRLPVGQRPRRVVNVQGDEPLIPPEVIDRLAECGGELATAYVPGRRGAVQVVLDTEGHALYFSRAAIPGRHPANRPVDRKHTTAWGAHIGIYAYSGAFLGRWLSLSPGKLEAVEGLEQLRALEAGVRCRVVAVETRPDRDRGIDGCDGDMRDSAWLSIDTEDDLARFAETLAHGWGEPNTRSGRR